MSELVPLSRRGFLSGLGALVGGIAIEQAIPFGRVWSFPKEVKCLNAVTTVPHMATMYYDKMALSRLVENFGFAKVEESTPATVHKSQGNYPVRTSNVNRF